MSAATRCSRPAATCATTCTASASRMPPASRWVSTSTTFTPERRSRDLVAELNLPRGTRLLVFAGRFSAEKNIPVLTEAFRRLGEPVSPAVDRRRRWRAAKATSRASRIAATTASSPATSRRPMHSCMPARTKPSGWWCWKPWPAAARWWPCAPGRLPELVDAKRGSSGRAARGSGDCRGESRRRDRRRCTNATWMRSAPRRGATWCLTTAGRGRCSRSWRATSRRWLRDVPAGASVAWPAPKPRT